MADNPTSICPNYPITNTQTTAPRLMVCKEKNARLADKQFNLTSRLYPKTTDPSTYLTSIDVNPEDRWHSYQEYTTHAILNFKPLS